MTTDCCLMSVARPDTALEVQIVINYMVHFCLRAKMHLAIGLSSILGMHQSAVRVLCEVLTSATGCEVLFAV